MSTEQAKPELTLNDLALMRNLIDTVSQRGAFKAEELSVVGDLFNKLNAFIKASQQTQEQPAEEQPAEEQGE